MLACMNRKFIKKPNKKYNYNMRAKTRSWFPRRDF